ncbi:peptidase C14, caspase catalytic subunit p20 [Sedimentitalea sp. CY04]|uniref:Peptidase C14, caspase catalytic subunit p20 n=2 Tax=Parasedimentitalea denitrificans TaxID=2211118 RepID=A0ABX0WA94_9RHOB|nr:caspase family protein [Sedimentitalea sp. CY04]NIZ62576.1 peptidase C14, caspase catalytic subunit p20 [Sedimentitalea sp. CY04]
MPLAWGDRANAEERLALIFGNSSYGSVAPLDNPIHDAELMSQSLERVGFKVTFLSDASQIEMKRAIAQFGRDLRNAGTDATGLFYYAGHGVQSFGNNYLLPVDVSLSDAADLDLVAVEAQSVLRQMASARNRTNIVILDACRNNPFSDITELNDNGLAEMKAPTGTFLAYATAPGGVALDGVGKNSPFTKALVDHIPVPGQPIEQLFKQVRRSVLTQSNGLQTPWDASSLVSDFRFVAKPEEPTPVQAGELQVWQSVQATRDPVQLTLFLRGYPNGEYADEARQLLSEVIAAELAPPSNDAVAPPTDAENQLFQAAQADGSLAAYEAYLQSYPSGTYSEMARSEVAALSKGTGEDPLAGQDEETVAVAEPQADEAPAQPEAGPITFASPLTSELTAVSGLSLAELITGSPEFPPVEGLPEAYWKDQTCANCHQWNRERLCTQANAYLSLTMQRSLTKQHPFGGVMKRALKSWATGGCQ